MHSNDKEASFVLLLKERIEQEPSRIGFRWMRNKTLQEQAEGIVDSDLPHRSIVAFHPACSSRLSHSNSCYAGGRRRRRATRRSASPARVPPRGGVEGVSAEIRRNNKSLTFFLVSSTQCALLSTL